jgi:hypothetical protein
MTKSNGLSGDNMTNGNDVLEFAEKHYDALCETFIKKHSDEWNEFVFAEFSNFEQSIDDLAHDSRLYFEMDGHDYYVDC